MSGEINDWRKMIEPKFTQEGYTIGVNTEIGPDNVTPNHLFKQVILANELDKMDYTEVELEFRPDGMSGLRYDVYGKSPTGFPVVGEIGELNTPSRKLIDRLQLTYKHADAFIWWAKDEYQTSPPMNYIDRLIDYHSSESVCDYCLDEKLNPIFTTLNNGPIQFENLGFISWIVLEHLFDPIAFHEREVPELN